MSAWARIGDLLIAVVLIALTLPLMVIVALAIKLGSPGPALSKREQWGEQGYRYQLYRFRTESHTLQESRFRNHPPVTRLGALLCRTRIDSLPQLFNVLRGDLTIVGTGRRRPDFVC